MLDVSDRGIFWLITRLMENLAFMVRAAGTQSLGIIGMALLTYLFYRFGRVDKAYAGNRLRSSYVRFKYLLLLYLGFFVVVGAQFERLGFPIVAVSIVFVAIGSTVVSQYLKQSDRVVLFLSQSMVLVVYGVSTQIKSGPYS